MEKVREKRWTEIKNESFDEDSGRSGEVDATVANREASSVCVWVDLAGCLCARLKIESDSHTYRRSQ